MNDPLYNYHCSPQKSYVSRKEISSLMPSLQMYLIEIGKDLSLEKQNNGTLDGVKLNNGTLDGVKRNNGTRNGVKRNNGTWNCGNKNGDELLLLLLLKLIYKQ